MELFVHNKTAFLTEMLLLALTQWRLALKIQKGAIFGPT